MLHAKGTLLTIDLTDQTVEVSEIDDLLREYIGGRGAATKLAHDRIPFDADPLGPENRLYISTGPLQNSQMSFTGRMNVTTLSPLTDGLASTNAGGYLSRNFTGTGHSVVELVGSADELTAIHVTDEGVEFEDASDLEGATVSEVSERINETHGLDSENLVTIGPAGENFVRYASIMTFDSRAFGRGGTGAVMGSKNVKTISFSGDAEMDVEIPDGVSGEIHRDAATKDHMMKRQGTTSGVDTKNELFSLPTKYFEQMSFEGVGGINGSAVEPMEYKKGTVFACCLFC